MIKQQQQVGLKRRKQILADYAILLRTLPADCRAISLTGFRLVHLILLASWPN